MGMYPLIVSLSFALISQPTLNVIKIAATNDVDTDRTLTFKDSSNKPDPCKEQLNGEKEELKRQNSLHKEFRQMTINDRNDPAIHKTFLISYLLDYTTRSPFGRATRKMRGYDLDSEESRNRMVCIKDYWRPEEGEKEGEIYRSLEEKNVPNIPRFYCGNVTKYTGTITLRKGAGTRFLRKEMTFRSLRNSTRRCPNPRH